MKLVLKLSAAIGMVMIMAAAAWADQPHPWQMWFQPAGSQMMRDVDWFGRYTFWFITPVTIFVMALLLIVIVRFNAKANPNPSRTTHNTLIEVVWTGLPILVLIAIAIPSFNLLNAQLAPQEEPAMTVKATGYQWYWGYEYQTAENPLSFDSVIMKEEDRAAMGKEDKAAYPRLLAVDNEIVVPVNTTVRLLVTAADVLHSFAMPAFGVKVDAVPGRLNHSWFKAEREGLYYGQCSELCGKDHAFMPIAFRVVSQERYDSWLEAARGDLSGANKALMASIAAENKIASAGN